MYRDVMYRVAPRLRVNTQTVLGTLGLEADFLGLKPSSTKLV